MFAPGAIPDTLILLSIGNMVRITRRPIAERFPRNTQRFARPGQREPFPVFVKIAGIKLLKRDDQPILQFTIIA
jgi:hypothetical protein